MSKEVESIISKFSTKKSPAPDGFMGEFYQAFIRRQFQCFSNYSSITLISQPDKDITRILQSNMADEPYDAKILQQDINKLHSIAY